MTDKSYDWITIREAAGRLRVTKERVRALALKEGRIKTRAVMDGTRCVLRYVYIPDVMKEIIRQEERIASNDLARAEREKRRRKDRFRKRRKN